MGRHSCKGEGQNWWEFNHHHYHHGWTIVPFAVFLYGLRLRPVGGKHHWCTPNLCFSTWTTHLAPSGFAARELHAFAAYRHHTSKPQQMCTWSVCGSRVRWQKCVCIHICHLYIHTRNNFMCDMQIQSKFNQNSYSIFIIWDVYTNSISTQMHTLFEEVRAFLTPKEFVCTICVPKSYLHQYDNITPGSSLKLTSPEHSQRAIQRAFLTFRLQHQSCFCQKTCLGISRDIDTTYKTYSSTPKAPTSAAFRASLHQWPMGDVGQPATHQPSNESNMLLISLDS